MEPKQHERYLRWQNYRVTQLSFSINLFLGFAVASLAYAINLKLGNNTNSNIPLEMSIIWWSFSAAFGCVSTITKLLDYRHTAKKIKEGGKFSSFMAKSCGYMTWGGFWIQVITYSVGAYLFIRGIIY